MKNIILYLKSLRYVAKIVLPSGVRGLLVAFVLLSACESPIQLSLVFTGQVAEPTDRSVQVEGIITDFTSLIIQHGHCWSKSPQPTVNDFKTELGTRTETGTFVSLLTDLEPNTLYFIRAYIITAEEVVYSEQISVQTDEAQVGIKDFQVITEGLSNIKGTTATAKGTLITEVNINLSQHGHVWDTQNIPTLTANAGKSELGALSISNNRNYTSNLTTLTPNTTYYYRAYSVDGGGVVYLGEVKEFRTTGN